MVPESVTSHINALLSEERRRNHPPHIFMEIIANAGSFLLYDWHISNVALDSNICCGMEILIVCLNLLFDGQQWDSYSVCSEQRQKQYIEHAVISLATQELYGVLKPQFNVNPVVISQRDSDSRINAYLVNFIAQPRGETTISISSDDGNDDMM